MFGRFRERISRRLHVRFQVGTRKFKKLEGISFRRALCKYHNGCISPFFSWNFHFLFGHITAGSVAASLVHRAFEIPRRHGNEGVRIRLQITPIRYTCKVQFDQFSFPKLKRVDKGD